MIFVSNGLLKRSNYWGRHCEFALTEAQLKARNWHLIINLQASYELH
jgi:hypothetical protein